MLPPEFPRSVVVAQTGVEIPALTDTGPTEVGPA
nr:MAG TPA: hypothetical protein [Caudoviricetes sp.]